MLFKKLYRPADRLDDAGCGRWVIPRNELRLGVQICERGP